MLHRIEQIVLEWSSGPLRPRVECHRADSLDRHLTDPGLGTERARPDPRQRAAGIDRTLDFGEVLVAHSVDIVAPRLLIFFNLLLPRRQIPLNPSLLHLQLHACEFQLQAAFL